VPGFAPVTIAETGASVSAGLIEIELASGARLRISGAVNAEVVAIVMRCLAKSAGRR
jgi:hypothetical protein